jgi:hypothetical protein
MPNLAKGHNVYQPSQGTYGAASTTLQQLLTHGDNPNDNGADPNNNGADPNDNGTDPNDNGAGPNDNNADLYGDDANLNDKTTDLVDEGADENPPPTPSSEVSPTRVSPPSLLAPTTASSTAVSHATGSTSAASSLKRKQSALSAVQSTGTSKKQCTNAGASAMDGIKQSLDNFNSTVAKSILVQPERMRLDTSPERRNRAVQLLERQEDYLTDDQLIPFFDYFKGDTAAADIYLAIGRESLRKAWGCGRNLGFLSLQVLP